MTRGRGAAPEVPAAPGLVGLALALVPVLVLVLLALVTVGAPSAAGAATPSPQPPGAGVGADDEVGASTGGEAGDDAARAQVDLAVTDSGTGTVRAGEPLRLGLQVSAASAADLAGARVLVVARTTRLPDSAALQRWADGRGASRGDLLLADSSLTDLRAGDGGPSAPGGDASAPPSGDVSVEVVADPEVLSGLGGSWGPRGLTVEVVDASGERLAAARTFVTWLPDGWSPTSRTDVAVLVPFSAGPPSIAGGRVPPERLEDLVAPQGRLRRTLAVASAPGVSWQVDPAALGEPAVAAPRRDDTARPGEAGERGEGGGAPAEAPPPAESTGGEPDAGPSPEEVAAGWRADLAAQARGHDVSVLPYGSPDPVGLDTSGADELWELADARGDELAASLPGATSRLARTGADGLTPGAVTSLDDTGRRVVVLAPPTPRRSAEPDAAPSRSDVRVRARAGDPARAASVRVLQVAGPATQVLVAGTTGDASARPTPAVTSARVVAESAALARAAPAGADADLLLAPPAGWDVDPGAAAPVLATVLASPWVSPRTLGDLAARPAATTQRASAASGPASALPDDGVATVVSSLQRARAGASALTAPGPYLDAVEASAVSAVSAAWTDDLPAWWSGVEELSASATAIDRDVRVVEGSAITVLSAQVDLPVTVVNDLDRAVDVTVSLDSSSPRLQPGGEQPISGLGPGDRQRVLVPVRAVASGDVTAQVVLRADDGTPIGSPATLRVRVRADWESRGTAVAAGVVVLVLLVGVVRTVRRNRRRAAERRAEDGDAAGTPRESADGSLTEDLSVSTGREPS